MAVSLAPRYATIYCILHGALAFTRYPGGILAYGSIVPTTGFDLRPNAYAFDSGDAKVWRVKGGFLVEIPRSVCNAALGVRRRLTRTTYSSKSRGQYVGLTPW